MAGDPKWEFGGSYREAVAGTEWLARDDWEARRFESLADSPEQLALRAQVAEISESLRVAQVATMTVEQADALDAVADDLEGYTPQPQLPLDPLFIASSYHDATRGRGPARRPRAQADRDRVHPADPGARPTPWDDPRDDAISFTW